jgi:hypothetical protein
MLQALEHCWEVLDSIVEVFRSEKGSYSSSSPRRLPKAPIRPPNFVMIFVPSSIALTVLSAVLKGAAGVVTAGAATLGVAFGVVVDGLAGTDFVVAGAPAGAGLTGTDFAVAGVLTEAGLAGVLAEATALPAEEVIAPVVLGLVVVVTDFGVTPGLAVDGVADLATGLLTVADTAAGFALTVFGVVLAGFGAGTDPGAAGLVTVPEAGAEVLDAGF